MEKNTAAPALSIYEIQRNAAESAISAGLEKLGLISRPADDGPDMTNVAIPAGDANGDAYEQVCAAWHREPCGDTKAALSHAILAMRPIFDASLNDDIAIMQAANLHLTEPAEEGVWAGDINGIIRFAQTFASHPAPQAAAEGVGSIDYTSDFVKLAIDEAEKHGLDAVSTRILRSVVSRAAPERAAIPAQGQSELPPLPELTDEQIYQAYAALNLPHAPVIWTAVLGTVRALAARLPVAAAEGGRWVTKANGNSHWEPSAPAPAAVLDVDLANFANRFPKYKLMTRVYTNGWMVVDAENMVVATGKTATEAIRAALSQSSHPVKSAEPTGGA